MKKSRNYHGNKWWIYTAESFENSRKYQRIMENIQQEPKAKTGTRIFSQRFPEEEQEHMEKITKIARYMGVIPKKN